MVCLNIFGFLLFFTLILPSSFAFSNMLFVKTGNISTLSFSKYSNKSYSTTSALRCGEKCLHFRNSSPCNSFSFNKAEKKCRTAQLPFLENPESIELIEEIYFHVDQLENVEMICRGGEDCCNRIFSILKLLFFHFLKELNYSLILQLMNESHI
ncbi:uncharacterized protein LOC111701079 [Eurytemora carolleeae]|uniref:uncharacterized protein LOC111701079 n=1 Tax=Eurytemora carolleeae TaxID=1294199 RepID=UPI000C791A1F|nr:uncharacterized protein LOC111701079 [Eurytemora carolleeae]|eukprot:XP_023327990.1 uncharacterized protein LOC111701079 [Eurytemora affinis]